MFSFADFVKATTTTTGTGDITLGSSPTGFRSFAQGFADQDVMDVLVVDNPSAPTQWEVFEATYNDLTTDTLTRGTLRSSSTGSRINFSSGTKTVVPAPSAFFFNMLSGPLAAWRMQPIGVPIPVMDNLTGANAPPTDQEYRYIKLTAGLTGAGQYNEGVLTNESTSGTAPLQVATAEISDAGSPMNGQTVHLVNTERRSLRGGLAGTVENDAFQGHRFGVELRTSATPLSGPSPYYGVADGGGQFAQSFGGTTSTGPWTNNEPSDNGTHGTPRVASETRSKNIGVTYYMRIR